MKKIQILLSIVTLSMLFNGCMPTGLQVNQQWCDKKYNCTQNASIMVLATNKNALVSALAAGTKVNGKRLKTTDTTVYLLKTYEFKVYDKYMLNSNTVYLVAELSNMIDHYLGSKVKIYNKNKVAYALCYPEERYNRKDKIKRVCKIERDALNLLLTGTAKLEIDIGENYPVVLDVTNPMTIENIKNIVQGSETIKEQINKNNNNSSSETSDKKVDSLDRFENKNIKDINAEDVLKFMENK